MNRHDIVDNDPGCISIDASAMYTDESQFYRRVLEKIQKHEIVNHSAKNGYGAMPTCTIDGYWGLLRMLHKAESK